MATSPPTMVMRAERRPWRARTVVATLAVSGAVGAVTWLVLTAARAPSVLSPPSIRGGSAGRWTLGPLHGLLSETVTAPHILHREMLITIVVVGVAWLTAWLTAPALPVRLLAGGVAAVHAVLFLAPPLSLTDVFNYGLYGRMAALHGLNPYRAVPAQASGDPLFALSNWHHLRSPYGPLFTLGTEGLGVFGVHGWYWAWKAVVVLSSLGGIAIAADIARRLGLSRERTIVAIGLSPLLLIGEVGGLHQDMPAMVCLLGAAWCLVRAREANAPAFLDPLAGALVVAAAGIKPSFAIVVGIVVFGARHRRAAFAGAVAAATAVGAIVLFVYGGALPDISSQSALVSPLSVPNLLGLAAGHGGADHSVRVAGHAVLIAIAGGATAAVLANRQRALGALCGVLFCSVLALSWVMPWYLIWALPFIALSRSRGLVALAAIATCWLTIGGLSTLPGILHSVGYFPTRLSTGRANHLAVHRLLR